MAFSDESASKTPDPTELTKKDRKNKKGKKKRKRKTKKKKAEPTALDMLWKKKSIFLGCRIGKIIY